MPILIVILARNSLPLTKAAVTSALANKQYSDCGLVVIDNASTDSTAQWLSSMALPRGFSTVSFRDQQSVAYCWNYMLDWAFSPALSTKYDGVLVCNNDVILRPDTVHHLMADPASFVTAVSVRSESELGIPLSVPSSRRPHPDFSCFLIKPACWKKVGRFDEGFDGAYCEDNDYHVRAHMAGVPLMCIDLPFVHYGCGALKSADKAEKRRIERQADRNRARFEDMYGCLPGTPAYEEIFR